MTPPRHLAPQEARLTFTVTDDDTAAALGSGSLPVLGTPGCWPGARRRPARRSSRAARPGSTSVGTRVALEHLAASPVGHRSR